MMIFVKNLYGTTVTVEVESTSDTVASVKAKLEESEGVPSQHQNLVCSARILRDGHKLSDYNVKEESTSHLLFRFVSCGGRCCSSDKSVYIYVQTRTSKTLALQVEPSSDTVADVRRKISDHQSLFLAGGDKLEDARAFGSYCGIQNDTTLHLDFGMQVFVKTLKGGGKTINIEVEPSDTVGDVKAKVQDQQRLIFDGGRLNDQRELGFYKVQHHSTLHLLDDLCSGPRDDAMHIAVKTTLPGTGSEAIRFKVKLTDKIGDLKAKIQDQQRLLFKGQQLVDVAGDGQRQTTLADYNVQIQSALHLDCPMQVFVKTASTGQTITLEVEPSETSGDVKEKIGGGHRSLTVTFDGDELDDGKTLAECNVHMGSTLHLD